MALMPSNAVDWSHHVLDAFLESVHIAVDLTAGNGKDTAFCAARCQKVYAFDIQPRALEKTAARLAAAGLENAELILDSHENLAHYLPVEEADAFVINLGYLPGGDKNITTRWASTAAVLSTVTETMKPGAAISLCVYPGHAEGKKESEGIDAFVATLPQEAFHVSRVDFPNQRNHPPQWIWIERY